eukprot:TRINITY_DN220_c0_g1_i1.p1 TRINITY_DN220_c0_g1~~TRINITY_DN220_c0_g1_i1.p1  ORF type:complete len:663 (-),score=139.29 TRINITY_DN220_c0_g1_i1:69-2057(-)
MVAKQQQQQQRGLPRAALLAALFCASAQALRAQPHIVVVVADDLGYADVSYNGGSVPTPFIDELSAEGVRLTNYYVHPTCTPSRAALLTGRYAHLTRLSGPLIGPAPFGLEANITTLPEVLRTPAAGSYATHMLGKWHLGHARPRYTPVARGFQTFYGSLLGACGFYSKRVGNGFDLHRHTENSTTKPAGISMTPLVDETHYTELLTREARRLILERADDAPPMFLYLAYTAAHSPLEPAPQDLARCAHMTHPFRRHYCGLVVGVDASLRAVVEALRERGMWDNTILVFTTDNGGNPWEGGSNAPLRGTKVSVYEGGVRGVAFAVGGRHTALGSRGGRDCDALMHISDWLPTLAAAAGVPDTALPSGLSGLNLLPALQGERGGAVRDEVVLHIDPIMRMAALRRGPFKVIEGRTGDHLAYPDAAQQWFLTERMGDWAVEVVLHVLDWAMGKDRAFFYHEIVRNLHEQFSDRITGHHAGVRLYNVEADPTESHDLAEEQPELTGELLARLSAHKAAAPPAHPWHRRDPNGRPQTGRSAEYPDVPFHTVWLDDEAGYVETIDVIAELEALVGKVAAAIAITAVIALAFLVSRAAQLNNNSAPSESVRSSSTSKTYASLTSSQWESLPTGVWFSFAWENPAPTPKVLSERVADLVNVKYTKNKPL